LRSVDRGFGAGGIEGCEGDVAGDVGGCEGEGEGGEEQGSEDGGAHGCLLPGSMRLSGGVVVALGRGPEPRCPNKSYRILSTTCMTVD